MVLSLYDICGEDMTFTAHRKRNGEIEMEVRNENDVLVYEETSSIASLESLAYFARQVTYYSDKITLSLRNEY